jgi:putative peptide zinc metalloprotease protein
VVKEGQYVPKGAILAEFTNEDLRAQEEDLRIRYLVQEEKVASYRAYANYSPEQEKAKKAAEADRDAAKMKWLYEREKNTKVLLLRAPRAGIVMSLPKVEEIGKRWEPGEQRVFCSVGDPNYLRVLVPVTPADYELIRTDLKKREKEKLPLDVTLRVHGRDAHTWRGRITHLPQSEAREIPVQLSNKGGGPLATKPTSPQGHYLPQNQVYLVGVEIIDPDRAISPGTLAQVKIHCEYRTAAWSVWRWISSTLDLGLL